MTSVRFYRGASGRLCGFSVIGHAGAGVSGEDMVCAGISALSQTAVNALETVAGIRTKPVVKAGVLSVRLPARLSQGQRHMAQIILRTARQGLYDIAAAYPQYIRISN